MNLGLISSGLSISVIAITPLPVASVLISLMTLTLESVLSQRHRYD